MILEPIDKNEALRYLGCKDGTDNEQMLSVLDSCEKELLKAMQEFPAVIQQAAQQYSPALIANYTYDLVREFNSFYQNVSILGADKEDEKIFRVQLAKAVGQMIKTAFSLLGIQVPNRM